MEHKLDDFFRKKIATTEETLPENTDFDEDLVWGQLQENIQKPQPNIRWRWVAAAVCLAGAMAWAIFIKKPAVDINAYNVVIRTPKAAMQPRTIAKADAPKPDTPQNAPVKKEMQESKNIQQPKSDIEVMALRIPEPVIVTHTFKQDSIHFQPPIVAETKPKFKTVHVNEISKTENEAVPQPKFKIRFAARNLP